MSVLRLLRTVRYLRREQIAARLRRRIHKLRVPHTPPPPVRSNRLDWQPPIARRSGIVDATTFRFLNRRHALEFPGGWNDAACDHLWLYNLHYFDDLLADDGEARRLAERLVERWIVENPPLAGVAWEPFTISLRTANWIKFAFSGGQLSDAAIGSLATQLRVLEQSVETHLLNNHVLANAKALVLGGLFFAGPESERWLRQGLDWYARQLPEQVLADGGHFERSPMYHSIVLEDLLDLRNAFAGCPDGLAVNDQSLVNGWTELVARMRRWLKVMCHPDGQIALFNDAAFGIAPNPKEIDAYCHRLGLPDVPSPPQGITLLEDSGYARLASGPATLIVDVGPIGPDHIPGHAHADTLSYELSLDQQRCVVDTGTSTYRVGPDRDRLRSTAAHNTVVVDDQDSSETWHAFRVARRARTYDLVVSQTDPQLLEVACSHDGYRRLPGRVRHRRQWQLAPTGLRIQDSLEGRFDRAVSCVHLHPDVQVVGRPSAGEVQLSAGNCPVAVHYTDANPAVEQSTYHPEFGVSIENRCIKARFDAARATTQWHWS